MPNLENYKFSVQYIDKKYNKLEYYHNIEICEKFCNKPAFTKYLHRYSSWICFLYKMIMLTHWTALLERSSRKFMFFKLLKQGIVCSVNCKMHYDLNVTDNEHIQAVNLNRRTITKEKLVTWLETVCYIRDSWTVYRNWRMQFPWWNVSRS